MATTVSIIIPFIEHRFTSFIGALKAQKIKQESMLK